MIIPLIFFYALKVLHLSVESTLYKGGAILNLSDPSGLVADIAALMKGVTDDKIYNNEENEFNRKLFLHTTIETIVESAKESYFELEDEFNHFINGPESYLGDIHSFSSELRREKFEHFGKQIQSRFLAHVDQNERENFVKEYKNKYQWLSENILVPLAKLHVKLMDSKPLIEQFDNHFDSNESHKKQGIEYVALFIACIKDTQEQALCAKQYENWFNSDNNLLQNAICFNQQELKQELKQIFSELHGSEPDSGKLIDLIEKGISEENLFLTWLLLNELSRTITHILTKNLSDNSAKINPIISRMARLIGKRFIIVQTNGNINQLISASMNAIKPYLEAGHKDGKRLNRALAQRFKNLQLIGVNDNGKKMRTGYLIIIDTKDFKKAEDVHSKVITIEERNKLIQKSIQSKIKAGAVLGVKRLGILAQISSMMHFYNKLDEGDKYERKFVASMASLMFIPVQFGINKLIMPRIVNATLKRFVGRGVSLVGSIISAGMGITDLIDGWEHKSIYQELALVEFLSGGFSILFCSAIIIKGPVSWVAGLWLIGVFMMIEYRRAMYEITDIEKWLMGTKWGITSDKLTEDEKSHLVRFLSLKQEQEALQIIMNKE